MPFTPDLALATPEEFAESVLRPLGTTVVAAGENFRFGRGRSGDLETLARLGFDVRPVPISEGISSTDPGGTAVADWGSGMRVELFHFDGCPLAPAAHRLVRQCLIALSVPDLVLVRVGDYPSPTVLVNGTDVMRPAAKLAEARACRIDVPTRERVLTVLRANLAAESGTGHSSAITPLDLAPR